MSKKRTIIRWVIFGLAVAINVFILVNGFLNGETSTKESDGFSRAAADVINSVSKDTITEQNFPAFAGFNRKLFGHFLLFVMSGLLSTFATRDLINGKKYSKSYFVFAFAMCFGVVIATLSELAQLMTNGRSFSGIDILIDSGGFLLGSLIIFLCFLRIEFKNKKSPVLQ